MKPAARINAALEILGEMQKEWAAGRPIPADKLLGEYTKQRRYMGSKDRAAVAELVYTVLRNGAALQWWTERAKQETNPRNLMLLTLVMLEREPLHKIEAQFSGEQYCPSALTQAEHDFVAEHLNKAIDEPFMPDWARANCPEWLEARLRSLFGDNFASEMKALNQEATVDLRVNTLRCADRGDLIFALDKEGIFAAPCEHSPLGVRLRKRAPIFTTKAYQEGLFEVQDEASQIAASMVEAKAGERVIDVCAGAGGKSLAIAAQMQNDGHILAWDNDKNRLAQLPKRVKRAGVRNIEWQVMDITQADIHSIPKADWVLVDAPCSGTGTWRRNPDLKWRSSPQELERVVTLQQQLLSRASQLVSSGGTLVYATCSLLKEENEAQIASFLNNHTDFEVEPMPQIWHKLVGCVVDQDERFFRVTPATHGMDGFFAARLKRKG